MKSKKSGVSAFVVVTLLIVIVASYLYLKNKEQTIQPAETLAQDAKKSAEFFQKPGENTSTTEPVVVPQTKTVTELEQTAQATESKASDYNLLATTYYQKGEKDKALAIIQEGLVKFPADDSLLKTKDLIENILPNL